MDNTVENKSTPIELYYLTCKEELNKLHNMHSALICRISGISDYILQEQLSTECVSLEEQLSIAQARFNEAERLLVDTLISDWYGDYLEFYRVQFIESDPITCMEKTNNINIVSDINKHRLRIPTSLKNRREICLISSFLKKKIILLDYEGKEIDSIGSDILSESVRIYINESGNSILPKALNI